MSQWVKALATELELDPQDPQVEENKLFQVILGPPSALRHVPHPPLDNEMH